jgi:hypothetical protein
MRATMNLFRVYGDGAGDTHLGKVELPFVDSANEPAGSRLTLQNIQTTSLDILERTDRRPDDGFHAAPRRQMVAILQGALEITTTTGERHRFQQGECLFADDVGTKGHLTRDVGDELLILLMIGIAEDWKLPSEK